jgi:hypothetical protein
MTESTAKKHMRAMLRSFTGGAVLHLLSEVFGNLAAEARREGDDTAAKQLQEVAAALFVVGMGVDAACPRK